MNQLPTLMSKLAIVLISSLIVLTSTVANPISDKLPASFEPQLTHLDHQSVALDWQTTMKTRAVIEFGINANNLDHAALIHQPQTKHQRTLTDLQPNTNYYFRIRINDLNGELISISPIRQFFTHLTEG